MDSSTGNRKQTDLANYLANLKMRPLADASVFVSFANTKQLINNPLCLCGLCGEKKKQSASKPPFCVLLSLVW